MTTPRLSASSRPGFTLVELLVVIAIIAVLASLGFGGFNAAMNSARKTTAKSHVVGLVQAIDAYYDDYSKLPNVSTASTNTAHTGSGLMNILVGNVDTENPKGISYFSAAKAKGGSSNPRNGLYRTNSAAGLYDPWGNAYLVVLDDNYDQKITDPLSSSETLYGVRSVAYTLGRDQATGGTDDVASWK